MIIQLWPVIIHFFLLSAVQAYAVSAIARWDWPEQWPDLFDQLVLALGSGEPPLVHGAMRVLSGKWTRESK